MNSLNKTILKYKKSGSLLDLGAGDGSNSLFFAKNNFEVTAIDNFPDNIKDLNKLSLINNIKINSLNEDFLKFDFKEYEVILANFVFHLLSKEESYYLINKMKSNTKKGGINVITAFTNENPPRNFRFLFSVGELKKLYADWEILYYSEYCSPISPHLTVKPESIVEIIARKNV